MTAGAIEQAETIKNYPNELRELPISQRPVYCLRLFLVQRNVRCNERISGVVVNGLALRPKGPGYASQSSRYSTS